MSLPQTLYTASQVRELDRIAIEDFAIPGYTLMQRAGQTTFEHIMARYPETRLLCVACGVGNNGGDGYVIARLALDAGLKVFLIQLGDEASIQGDAQLARQAFLDTGAKVYHYASGDQEVQQALADADVIVDALFGTGLSRAVEGHWAKAIKEINQSKAKVASVDIPSGLNADSGAVLGDAVSADLTVTYIGLKCGLFTGRARDYVGELAFDDLGVPFEVYQYAPVITPQKELMTNDSIRQNLRPRARVSHKGDFGHVLCIGGAQGMSGAIRLAAEGALRTGAGLVSIATHPSHAAMLNLTRPEIMVSAVEHADDLSPLIEKVTVILIGPGLGKSAWAQDLLTQALAADKPKVLDADALNLLAEQHFSPGSELSTVLHKPLLSRLLTKYDNWVLTPHPGEAARLLLTKTALIEQDRFQAVELLQKKFAGVCVLKGAGSLICDGVKTMVCPNGNPGMASGGMGDVLSGVIAALLAQGLSLSDAANIGVFVHGEAADFAAQQGERGMLASDLFPFIRMLVNNVHEKRT